MHYITFFVYQSGDRCSFAFKGCHALLFEFRMCTSTGVSCSPATPIDIGGSTVVGKHPPSTRRGVSFSLPFSPWCPDVFAWFSRGFRMAFAWRNCDVCPLAFLAMILHILPCSFFSVRPWCFAWFSHGFRMVFAWLSHGKIVMCAHLLF